MSRALHDPRYLALVSLIGPLGEHTITLPQDLDTLAGIEVGICTDLQRHTPWAKLALRLSAHAKRVHLIDWPRLGSDDACREVLVYHASKVKPEQIDDMTLAQLLDNLTVHMELVPWPRPEQLMPAGGRKGAVPPQEARNVA